MYLKTDVQLTALPGVKAPSAAPIDSALLHDSTAVSREAQGESPAWLVALAESRDATPYERALVIGSRAAPALRVEPPGEQAAQVLPVRLASHSATCVARHLARHPAVLLALARDQGPQRQPALADSAPVLHRALRPTRARVRSGAQAVVRRAPR